MKIINFNIEHLDLIELEKGTICKQTLSTLNLDYAKSFIKDSKIIFVLGLQLIRQGVAQCWSIPTIYTEKNKLFVYKKTINFIKQYAKKLNIHRLQTPVNDENVKWIETLGFKKESTLKKITFDKKDEYLYVKFFDNDN
jgi:3'-phosphoadenosine 5'-phosphosulfate sulfotransferase (PAPS reductase)/FAD synthetase